MERNKKQNACFDSFVFHEITLLGFLGSPTISGENCFRLIQSLFFELPGNKNSCHFLSSCPESILNRFRINISCCMSCEETVLHHCIGKSGILEMVEIDILLEMSILVKPHLPVDNIDQL